MLEKPLLKESVADLDIHEHYEQRFLGLEYIFQYDHCGSKISDFKKLRVADESINTKSSPRNESRSIENDDFTRGSDWLGSI